MAFIASNGLTEAGTSKTIEAGGMTVHYHDIGTGEPVLFLHSYGPGTTAWITFYKTIGVLSQHFRCILMDMPNFSKTGPIVYHEGVHAVQARTAVALMDALGIQRAHFVGNSQGGQSSMVQVIACACMIWTKAPVRYLPAAITPHGLRMVYGSHIGALTEPRLSSARTAAIRTVCWTICT